MRHELSLTNHLYSYDDLSQAAYLAEQNNFDLVSGPLSYITYLQTFLTKTKIGAIIGYPYGISPVSIKCREIAEAIELKVDIIDIVLNHFLMLNQDLKKLDEEIKTCTVLADIGKVNFAYILDYPTLGDDDLLGACYLLLQHNVFSVLTTVGVTQDDLAENILACQKISKTKIKPILATNNYNPSLEKSIKKAGVNTIRLNSYYNARRFFSIDNVKI